MARRATRQVEKPAPRAVPQLARSKTAKPTKTVGAAKSTDALSLDGLSADQKLAALLRDREKLLTRLQAAQARVAALEAREEQLADRISWALDTLNDLMRLPDAS